MTDLDPGQERFARIAIRKKRLFRALSLAGIVIAAALAVDTTVRRYRDPGFRPGPRAVIVLLILLNARQNLRQYRYAGVLERVVPSGEAEPGC